MGFPDPLIDAAVFSDGRKNGGGYGFPGGNLVGNADHIGHIVGGKDPEDIAFIGVPQKAA